VYAGSGASQNVGLVVRLERFGALRVIDGMLRELYTPAPFVRIVCLKGTMADEGHPQWFWGGLGRLDDRARSSMVM
jgi:hypothetical protein